MRGGTHGGNARKKPRCWRIFAASSRRRARNWLARTLIAPTFDPRTGTLDGLLASGRLGILKSGVDQLQTVREEIDLILDEIEASQRR